METKFKKNYWLEFKFLFNPKNKYITSVSEITKEVRQPAIPAFVAEGLVAESYSNLGGAYSVPVFTVYYLIPDMSGMLRLKKEPGLFTSTAKKHARNLEYLKYNMAKKAMQATHGA